MLLFGCYELFICCLFYTIQYFLLTTPHKGFFVTIYNSRGNQIDIAQIVIYKCFLQIKCWFLVRGENRSTRGKTSRSRVENQQTQSHLTPSAEIEPGPHWWKARIAKNGYFANFKTLGFRYYFKPFLHRTAKMWFCSRFSNVLI